MNITKRKAAELISVKTGLDIEDVEVVLEAYHKVIMTTVTNGDSHVVRGFGVFEPIHKAAKKLKRKLKNVEIDLVVPQRVEPKFRPFSDFKQKVDKAHKAKKKK